MENYWMKKHETARIGKVWEDETRKCLSSYGDMCEGVEDDTHRKTLSMIIENQRLINCSMSRKPIFESNLIKEIYGPKFLVPKWVHCHTMMGPSVIYPVSMHAKSKKLRVHLDDDACKNYLEDNENVEELANLIRHEIQAMVIADLRSHAGIRSEIEYDDDNWIRQRRKSLSKVANKIFEETSVVPKNLIVPSHLKERLFASRNGLKDNYENCAITTNGLHNKLKLYFIDAPSLNTLIMTAKSDVKEQTGYFYGPYVPLTETSVILCEDFCPRKGILTRFGKTLTKGGEKLFARIDISNLP